MAINLNRTFDLSILERYKKGLQANYGKFNDPTYLGFILMFNDYDTHFSPLLVSDPNKKGSALYYLRSIGDVQRFEYLKAFQKLLSETNYWMPWYWQSIQGIDKVWDYNDLTDPYKGGQDAILTITTLESVDMRITALMDLYRKACFDYEYRREIIPANLRIFQLTIFIQEIRSFQTDFGTIGNALNTFNSASNAFGGVNYTPSFETPLQKSATETASVTNEFGANLMFTLNFCEFESDKSSSVYSTFSNSEPEQMAQQLVISYENIDNTYLNPLAGQLPAGFMPFGHYFPQYLKMPAIETSDGLSFAEKARKLADDPDYRKDVMSGPAKQAGAAAANAALNSLDNLGSQAQNLVEGRLNRLLLGNVYGFSPSNILTSLQQGSLLSLGPQIQNIANSSQPEQNNPANLGNIYRR